MKKGPGELIWKLDHRELNGKLDPKHPLIRVTRLIQTLQSTKMGRRGKEMTPFSKARNPINKGRRRGRRTGCLTNKGI